MFRIILAGILFCTQATFANTAVGQPTNKDVERFAASFKNTGEVLGLLKLDVPNSEVADLEKFFVSQGVDLKQSIPDVKIDKNKVFIGENTIEIVSGKAIMFNGVRFKYDLRSTLKENFENLMKTQKNYSFNWFELLIPKANAFSIGTARAVAGIVIALGISYYVAIGTGIFYIGKELYEYIKSGKISCDDKGYFVVRIKTRNKALLATSVEKIITAEEVKSILELKKAPRCTKELAEEVSIKIKKAEVLPNPSKKSYPYKGEEGSGVR